MRRQRFSPLNSAHPNNTNLASLAKRFENNPYSTYKLVIHKGCIHSLIDAEIDQVSTLNLTQNISPERNNAEQQILVLARREKGLFAGIIKQMEATKQQKPVQIAKAKPIKNYQFYFSDIKRKNDQPLTDRSNSPLKKIKDFKDQIVRQNHQTDFCKGKRIFCLDGQRQQQTSSKVSEQLAGQGGMGIERQLINIDFSFDKIDQRVSRPHNPQTVEVANVQANLAKQSVKAEQREENKKELYITDMPKYQSLRMEGQLPIKSIQGKDKASEKQVGQNKQSEVLPPISYLESSRNHQQSYSFISGTKKAESQIIQFMAANNRSVEIQFDLDLNFI